MGQEFPPTDPDSQFATLIRIARTYCHPEADEEAYDALKRLAQRREDQEMSTFKNELRRAIQDPAQLPGNELFRAVQYDDGSAEKFLRRLWRDLYGDEPVESGDGEQSE
ncbi:MAG: hypothetical protein GEV03_16260 [Streptosporangiales bacterium]|nr:hypothetical protein [Streptosporangiales bacterium]